MNPVPYPDPVGGVADGLAAVVALRELAASIKTGEHDRALAAWRRELWAAFQFAEVLEDGRMSFGGPRGQQVFGHLLPREWLRLQRQNLLRR